MSEVNGSVENDGVTERDQLCQRLCRRARGTRHRIEALQKELEKLGRLIEEARIRAEEDEQMIRGSFWVQVRKKS